MSNTQLTPRMNRLEPNLVIDGAMQYWPEGVSRSVANNVSLYGSVLFKCTNANTGITLTNAQDLSVPVAELPVSNKVSKTASGSLAAGTASGIEYYVEGYDILPLMRQEFSVLVWVKSSVAATRSISIRNNGATHGFVQQYTIGAANTWQLVVKKFPALNTCPGSLNRTNGLGLNIRFNIVSGSNHQTSSLNQWVAGNIFQGPSEETTWLTGTTHDFLISGVVVLPGDWTDLEDYPEMYQFIRAGRNMAHEIELIERYFHTTYDFETVVGTATESGAIQFGAGTSTHRDSWNVRRTRMRTTPTTTYYDPEATNPPANTARDRSTTSQVPVSPGDNGQSRSNMSFAATAGRHYSAHVVDDARF